MAWVGVDGGGTRSRAMAVDARGQELATADGPSALISATDPTISVGVVRELVRRVAASAGASLPLEGVWAGLAGAGLERPRRAVEAVLQRSGLARRVRVGTDVEAARADAFGEAPGILFVAGTGSVVLAVDPRGERVTAGGWGALLDDEASGYGIGLDGLRAVVRSADGREPATLLTERFLAATQTSTVADLVEWAFAATKRDVAWLAASAVFRAAREGDPLAARIVHRALGEARALLAAILDRTDGWEGPPTVALCGGLFRNRVSFREPVAAIVAELGCNLHPEAVVPERGAARKAMALTGQ